MNQNRYEQSVKVMSVHIHLSTIVQALFVVIFVFLPTKVYGATAWCFLSARFVGKDIESSRRSKVNILFDEKDACDSAQPGRVRDNDQNRKIRLYKDLYFKLQNLEQFPGNFITIQGSADISVHRNNYRCPQRARARNFIR